MREGVDYAWGHLSPAQLKRHGKSFVIRYVSSPGNTKNITKAEAAQFLANDIDVGIVFETDANRALDGFAAGVYDANRARDQVIHAGGPKDGGVIYFACDFDATLTQQKWINNYLAGCAKVLGKNRVGVYGGYWVVKRALDLRICKYGWQTYAWSGGKKYGPAHLYQYNIFGSIEGVSVDFDQAWKDDFGQWFYEPPGPTPYPGPHDEEPYWQWLRWQLGEGEFKGHGSDPAWRPKSLPVRIPASWWVRKIAFLAARKVR